MTDFRRIKIQATVETAGLLLSEADTASMMQTLRNKLEQLDLAVLTIESKEEPSVPWNDSLDSELD
jgi:chaperonin cofactor prefoldin